MEESVAETAGMVTELMPAAEEEDEDDDDDNHDDLAGRFLRLEQEQNALLQALPPFGEPVSHVYHPLDYAWEPHCDFVRHTGVPFGEAWHVREWLRVVGGVKKPPSEHPKRPVLGLACRRAEKTPSRRCRGLDVTTFPGDHRIE
ncbi:single-strand selective monofunctional uracil DNA glycosylase [Grus japonensis]|uniref:Single-strand selective monofunctional uracil DNA glycosylase n=1 Tax=Grus japonensis TaxID=30415 RepID=A0ABC9XUI2_GRUJA